MSQFTVARPTPKVSAISSQPENFEDCHAAMIRVRRSTENGTTMHPSDHAALRWSRADRLARSPLSLTNQAWPTQSDKCPIRRQLTKEIGVPT